MKSKLVVEVIVKVGVQLLFWVGGWVGGENKSNTKINSVFVKVRVELGKKSPSMLEIVMMMRRRRVEVMLEGALI